MSDYTSKKRIQQRNRPTKNWGRSKPATESWKKNSSNEYADLIQIHGYGNNKTYDEFIRDLESVFPYVKKKVKKVELRKKMGDDINFYLISFIFVFVCIRLYLFVGFGKKCGILVYKGPAET